MSRNDPTAPQRLARWRERMHAEGWRRYHIWLDQDDKTALEAILAASGGTRRAALTGVLQLGIQAATNTKAERHGSVHQGSKVTLRNGDSRSLRLYFNSL